MAFNLIFIAGLVAMFQDRIRGRDRGQSRTTEADEGSASTDPSGEATVNQN